MKTRLPKYSQVSILECSENEGSCPAYLLDNLRYHNCNGNKYALNSANISGTAKENIAGYWLLASYFNYNYGAYYVAYHGKITYVNTRNVNSSGIRPVITVPIMDLS